MHVYLVNQRIEILRMNVKINLTRDQYTHPPSTSHPRNTDSEYPEKFLSNLVYQVLSYKQSFGLQNNYMEQVQDLSFTK